MRCRLKWVCLRVQIQRHFGWACTIALSLALSSCASPKPPPPQAPAVVQEKADRVIIAKLEHKLYLMQGSRVLYVFPIALGQNPREPKHAEGDGRTPEGSYVIDWRNPNSQFYLSLHISYPNDADTAWAHAHGMEPGSNIMIHGLPSYANVGARHVETDWTDGCIAVTNEQMDIIWRLVDDNTPILILPQWSDSSLAASF